MKVLIFGFFFLLIFGGMNILIFSQAYNQVDSSELLIQAPRLKARADLSSYKNQCIGIEGDIDDPSCLILDTWIEEQDFLALKRKVEVYAYQEEQNGTSDKRSLRETWTEWPQDDSEFSRSKPGPQPTKAHESLTWFCSAMQMDAKLAIDDEELELPYQKLPLSKRNTKEARGFRRVDSEFLFSGKGSLAKPQIGDTRISYEYVPRPLKNHVVFGLYTGAAMQAYPLNEYTYIYKAYPASRSSEDIAEELSKAHWDNFFLFIVVSFLATFATCTAILMLLYSSGVSYYFSRRSGFFISFFRILFSASAVFVLSKLGVPYFGAMAAMFYSYLLFFAILALIVYFTRWKADA